MYVIYYIYIYIFFINKFRQIRTSIDQHKLQTQNCTTQTSLTIFDSFHPVTITQLHTIINSSKPSSCALDPIPTSLLLECLDVILPTLTHIIDTSILSGQFPTNMKTAIVKPLLRKCSLDIDKLKNYRPVSNLSFMSKFFEEVVLQQLVDYLDNNNLLCTSQSVYRPHHSTETLLLKTANNILLGLDKRHVSLLTLLDLSSAFDTIDHNILLDRLNYLHGISGTCLSCFRSYLSNRRQSVAIANRISSAKELHYGVLQGSVLGPILFVLCIQPHSNLIKQHSLSVHLFADDIQIKIYVLPQHVHVAISSVEICISDVKYWMIEKKLQLNNEKTECLLIRPNKCTQNFNCTSLSFGRNVISFSTTAKNLGFHFTDDMRIDTHI